MDERSSRRGGHPARQMLAIGVIGSILGIALGLLVDWFPTAASTQAKKVDTVYDVLVIASVPFFVLVTTVVLFSVWKFRMRPGEEDLDGPPIHGNTRLEVIWTAVPAILILSLVTYAYIELRDIEKRPSGPERVVTVQAEQFAWSFVYPGTDKPRVGSEQLYLPVGESVEFRLRSADVIHDFWVPDFRMKLDAVPGIVTKYRVTPRKVGSFPIVCAELCGLGHSSMRDTVHVLPKTEFAAWLSKQKPGSARVLAVAQGG